MCEAPLISGSETSSRNFSSCRMFPHKKMQRGWTYVNKLIENESDSYKSNNKLSC